MIENAKTGSNLVEHLDLRENATAEEVARHETLKEKKSLLSSSPSSAVVWGVLAGFAILVATTFLLLF